ncbi:hypothetical protein HKX48_000546 [Thoreauomyces humboldtii]|nr:hypothetical protein HKX48_000546 [Thoreauomyces humboldtii]
MLASLDLFKDNILIIVRILKKLSSNESDFTRVVIEVLYTIYDVDLQESQSRSEGSSDEEIDADLETEKAMQMLKCLDVIGCVLECTEENLNDNASMAGILESFILPSLKSTHLDTQFAAFQCLSLACLLDRTLAVAHLKLFLSAFHDPRIELSTLAMQKDFPNGKVFFDLAVLFGTDSMLDKELLSELISGNLQCEDEGLLTLAVEGAAKLMMLGCLTDPIILQHVVVLYYHPHTREMNRLRQCLSYFMPVFAHASHANQRLLQTVVVPTLELLGQEYVDSKDMLSPTHIGQQLIDWCDPRKVVRLDGGSTPSDEEGSHGDLAVLMLAAIEESDDPVMQKLYAQLLSKLYLGLFVAPEKLAQIAEATASQIQMLPKPSAVVNPLKKFAKSIADLDETSVAAGTADEFLKQQNLIVAMSGLRLQADPNRLPTAAVAGEASGDEDD